MSSSNAVNPIASTDVTTGTHAPSRFAPRQVALPILLGLSIAMYFVALGGLSIWDANEAFYVETPREMIEAHDYINPSFNYLPRFNKPVLSYWIVAIFYKVFGVSVGVQRLPIALGALVIIGCAFVLGRLAFDDRSPWPRGRGPRDDSRDPRPRTRDLGPRARDVGPGTRDEGLGTQAGLWSAVGLAAAPRLVMFARRIFIDIWVTAFMSLTLAFFALSERYPARRRLFLVLMYVCVGLGVLTKGPVAVALPALAFGLYLLATRELRRVTDMMLPLGIVIVAAIVVPWYALLYQEHGWTYIRSFFISENLERYTSGFGVRQQRGVMFYLPVIISDSFPVSAFLFTAAAIWTRERSRIQTLLWCWIVAIVAFFSFSAGKQDLYIFPIVAAVGGLGGSAIAQALCDASWRGWLRWTLAVTGALVALAGAAVLWLFVAGGRVYALDGAMFVAVCGLVGGVLTLSLALAWRQVAAILTLFTAIIAIDYTFVGRVLPDFERYKPVPAIAGILRDRLHPGDIVAHYQIALPSMVYYLGRHVDEYFLQEPFVKTMRSDRRVYAVLSADDYADLRPLIGARTCVLDRWPTFDVRLRNVLSRQPLPELFLITNDCNR
jgi:4-amino-4-deoxy-L-arabinose transferase-like glycosyltransferase